jgi:hypothetical protein
MIEASLKGVEFIAVNTDAQALLASDADVKLDVGRDSTRGLGAGADPEVGRRAAEDAKDDIEELLRGAERPIPTVMRSAHVIYVREEAPERFAYTVAKALDEHQELFRMYGDPWYYDTRLVAKSTVIPLASGAERYYRERGYLK